MRDYYKLILQVAEKKRVWLARFSRKQTRHITEQWPRRKLPASRKSVSRTQIVL